ncbi:hypothetical protein ACFWP5_26565 [Streptomyces sp. NPDC058469]|uniref:hypothetical protein n=1 Tax=Streptomyces sp. NPDC058469 TaxID=3346514 RepID=UPI0036571769
MAIWEACLWGLLGAGLIEAKEMWQLYRQNNEFPWKLDGRAQAKPYVAAVAIRFFMAGGINAAYASANQVTGSLGALTLGIAAPMFIQQLAEGTLPKKQESAFDERLDNEAFTPSPARLETSEHSSNTDKQHTQHVTPATDHGSPDGQ